MKSNSIDMTEGSIFNKIILFAIPLMLSSILQLLFNAADLVVVGKFAGSESLAAVGSTNALINLLVNLFIGLSMGASVVMGRCIGARRYDEAHKALHTAMAIATVGGVMMIFVGYFASAPMLKLMATPDDVINLSILYMKIYFMGMPGMMAYNFGSAILRSAGDTKRPLYFLTVAGVINVILNLILVIGFHMGVAGVAIATAASQYISGFFVVMALVKSEGYMQLHLKELRFHKDQAIEMIRIGFPAGLQGIIFSISNVLIQSSVNSFGKIVMAGNTAASNIEGFVYTAMNSIYQTALSFTSQNMGAKRYDRIDKILFECQLTVIIIGLVAGIGAYTMGDKLLAIYDSDPEVIGYGLTRMSLVCAPYFLCGMMDVMVGSLRGMGYSIMPMIVSLTGACLFRVIWILTVFAANHTLFTLYISYPISWALTFSIHLLCYLVVRRKFKTAE
ncbi:MAG: MATE family efflux transporter [Erysipelotrichaceae bacterium]|nr:MATE family efflux transporter [Erysipelotrichaceae bacterium]